MSTFFSLPVIRDFFEVSTVHPCDRIFSQTLSISGGSEPYRKPCSTGRPLARTSVSLPVSIRTRWSSQVLKRFNFPCSFFASIHKFESSTYIQIPGSVPAAVCLRLGEPSVFSLPHVWVEAVVPQRTSRYDSAFVERVTRGGTVANGTRGGTVANGTRGGTVANGTRGGTVVNGTSGRVFWQTAQSSICDGSDRGTLFFRQLRQMAWLLHSSSMRASFSSVLQSKHAAIIACLYF